MADFHQNGIVSTLHNLSDRPVEELDACLKEYSKSNPMTLVLPSLYSELEGSALKHIVDELKQVSYLNNIVIGLDQADRKQFEHALSYFSELPQQHSVLWNDGPRLRAVDEKISEQGLAPIAPGKGRNVWYCFGYVMAACQDTKVVGLHDCDIITYDQTLLARLFYPVANPYFSYIFSKGYYARVAEGKMNGRVMRLLVTPLIQALKKVYGDDPYLDYLAAFRYPLAGEFAMDIDVISDLRIPNDWGLEIGILSEIRRNYSPNMICQVELADTYDHKHQDVSEEDKNKGLYKMSVDIIVSIFRKLAADGKLVSEEHLRAIKATYLRGAMDLVEMYEHDATLNGLAYNVHLEEKTVELFAANIIEGGRDFIANPTKAPFVPRWNRVRYAVPDVLERLEEAVRLDYEEMMGAGKS
ncbi:MAG: glycosyl transferase [Micavibrio sp.]|nr:glycosyl transferase [Micavibrio sp.]|tara:strand:- start:2037 stop:3275 length:1239 start_codon:yes stop_codon:yes gene_type:complete